MVKHISDVTRIIGICGIKQTEKKAMRKWMLWGIVLALALTACGGKKEKKEPALTPSPTPLVTEEPGSGTGLEPSTYAVYTPGLQVKAGLTLVTYSLYSQAGTTYFWGEVRNDTGQTVSRITSSLYPLDSEGVSLSDNLIDASALVTDIPPGQTVFVAAEFPTPDQFAGTAIWVQYETGAPGALLGFYNLPVTIDSQGPGEVMGYTVTGTIQNNSGKDLLVHSSVVDVALIGPDDRLVGFTRAIITPGSADGQWAAGQAAAFEALFAFTAVEADQIKEVRVSAVGYAVP
jgi:hypothetical protein